ncbi:hypothetical protein C8R41DRAFT_981247 [Lentinula lateritia]|uniref:Uncharacterized protein n=1 Tax=Lentinula lateritia TaxID=40482 RepID=A0ABQ8VF55_9AGAR|nr:hypothetical protein C8R41DRAFT_981247 [Lentinula lateritia]
MALRESMPSSGRRKESRHHHPHSHTQPSHQSQSQSRSQSRSLSPHGQPLVTSGTDSSNRRLASGDVEQENERLKRKIDALELEKAERARKSQKRGTAKSIESQGRGLCRMASMFTPIAHVVMCYYRYNPDVSEEEEEVDFAELGEKEKEEYWQGKIEKSTFKRNIWAYYIVKDMIAGFHEAVTGVINGEVGGVTSLCRQLQKGATQARGEDIHTLQAEVANWLNSRPPGKCAHPILSTKSRANRGFKHDLTGKLLCPIHLDWSNITIRAQIRAKNIKTSNSFFLRCFYHDEEGDADDVEKGFLRSTLLIQVWQQIFRSSGSITSDTSSSPHSSENEFNDAQSDTALAPAPRSSKTRASTKHTVAQIYGLTKVTPRTIAYSCVLLRFSLSNATSWGQDSSFNYEGLYNEIVDYFEGKDEVLQDELNGLLEWWNEQAFAEEDASKSITPSVHFQNVLDEQRAAKRAAAQDVREGDNENGSDRRVGTDS